MKLAKKTLSVALAAVMAASSFAGTFSAFAAAPKALAASEVKYTAFSGAATVKPNVKIDNQYHKLKSELTTENDKTANKLAQVDKTTLSTYYSFTPTKTGYYFMHVESTPVFYGYDQGIYETNKKANVGYTEEELLELCHVYRAKPDGLFKDTSFNTAMTEKDAIDSVTIDNITSDDKDDVTRDPFVKTTTTVESKYDFKNESAHVLSYKYIDTSYFKGIVADKTVASEKKGEPVELVNTILQAGKTYYFKATLNQDTVIDTAEEKVKDSKNEYYVNTVKNTQVAPEAKIYITRSQEGLGYGVGYETVAEKDYQVLACPKGTSIVIKDKTTDTDKTYTSDYDTKLGKSVVKLPVEKAVASATYHGMGTSVTVEDTYLGANVERFHNAFAGVQSVTLGKYVKTISGLSTAEAPHLKSLTINNPEFTAFDELKLDREKVKISVPANSPAWYEAAMKGYVINVTCTHKWTTVKAATIFAAGQRKCSECDKVEAIAKKAFAPTAKASKKKIVCKGNAGKVAKLAVWVYDSKGKLVKKQVKKNVTKNTVKVAKAGKYTVKIKAYGTNGAKTKSVKKTVKVK